MAQPIISPAQIRAARALLNMTQADLAQASSVGIATIKRLELANDASRITAGVLLSIQTSLEKAGVELIFEDDTGGIGVRLRRKANGRSARQPSTSRRSP